MRYKRLPLILLFAALILSACATVKHVGMRPADGPCAETYDSAMIGERESIAGAILMPLGVAILTGGVIPWVYQDREMTPKDEYLPREMWALSFSSMIIGSAVLGAGIIVMADGHVRVNAWERYCAGTTAAQKYCLYDTATTILPVGETLP